MCRFCCSVQICKQAAMGSANDSTSKGGCDLSAPTVLEHESVIQKYLKPSAAPLPFSGVKRLHVLFGNTPWVA